MLYYERIDISEGIDVNKTSESKEFDICHYWLFLDKWLKFQPDVCNECHDILMMSLNFSNIAILNIKGVDYRFNNSRISKTQAVSLLQKADLLEKIGSL